MMGVQVAQTRRRYVVCCRQDWLPPLKGPRRLADRVPQTAIQATNSPINQGRRTLYEVIIQFPSILLQIRYSTAGTSPASLKRIAVP